MVSDLRMKVLNLSTVSPPIVLSIYYVKNLKWLPHQSSIQWVIIAFQSPITTIINRYLWLPIFSLIHNLFVVAVATKGSNNSNISPQHPLMEHCSLPDPWLEFGTCRQQRTWHLTQAQEIAFRNMNSTLWWYWFESVGTN